MRKALERLVKVTKEFMDANKAEVDLLRSRVKELSEENKRLKREIFKYKINGQQTKSRDSSDGEAGDVDL